VSVLKKNDHRTCVKCGSPNLRRSRTRIWERPLRLLLLRPYRCRDCGHRQYNSVLRQGAVGVHHLRSFPDDRTPPGIAQATEGMVRIRTNTRWVLIYGFLACLLIGAIARLSFKNGFPSRPSSNAKQSSSAPPAHKANEDSTGHETSALKSSPVGAPQTTGAVHKSKASVQLPEPRSSSSHEDDTHGSSSAEAIRAQRPRLPAEIKSTITSDNTVAVRVRIDQSGRVIRATAVSASGPVATSLVPYALDTARRWRFRPARSNGKAVGSEKVLEFLFRPSDS